LYFLFKYFVKSNVIVYRQTFIFFKAFVSKWDRKVSPFLDYD